MANPPDDEERTLDRYGERLGALDALRAPEPRPGLEARMWARLADELAAEPRRARARWTPGSLRWALVGAGAVAIVAASFVAGRLSGPRAPGPAVASAPSPVAPVPPVSEAMPVAARERLLDAALGAHLAASERMLIELANQPSPSLDDERRFAEALLASNRLYRRAAERAGQRRVATLLAELEPLFAELAHAPAEADPLGVAAVRDRLESQDLLFKVRITRKNL
jgi:hypothetical protein